MPFFNSDIGLVFFFHVPKSGGTSVEDALVKSGFKLSFLSRDYWTRDKRALAKSSPQHICVSDFEELFEASLFSFKFTLVRDPVTRLLSAFNHNRRKIGLTVTLSNFLTVLENSINSSEPFLGERFDNHFLPANRLVPEDCEVYHLERDLGYLEVRLNSILKREISLRQLKNVGNYSGFDAGIKHPFTRWIFRRLVPPSPTIEKLNYIDERRILQLYTEDYDRFFGRNL